MNEAEPVSKIKLDPCHTRIKLFILLTGSAYFMCDLVLAMNMIVELK